MLLCSVKHSLQLWPPLLVNTSCPISTLIDRVSTLVSNAKLPIHFMHYRGHICFNMLISIQELVLLQVLEAITYLQATAYCSLEEEAQMILTLPWLLLVDSRWSWQCCEDISDDHYPLSQWELPAAVSATTGFAALKMTSSIVGQAMQ